MTTPVVIGCQAPPFNFLKGVRPSLQSFLVAPWVIRSVASDSHRRRGLRACNRASTDMRLSSRVSVLTDLDSGRRRLETGMARSLARLRAESGRGWEGGAGVWRERSAGVSIVPRLNLYCSSIVPLLAGRFFRSTTGWHPQSAPIGGDEGTGSEPP